MFLGLTLDEWLLVSPMIVVGLTVCLAILADILD